MFITTLPNLLTEFFTKLFYHPLIYTYRILGSVFFVLNISNSLSLSPFLPIFLYFSTDLLIFYQFYKAFQMSFNINWSYFLYLPLFDQIKYWQPVSVPNMLFLFGQLPSVWNPKIWDSFPQSTNLPPSSTLALSAFSLIYCFSGIKASFHFLLQQLYICWLQYLDFMAH